MKNNVKKELKEIQAQFQQGAERLDALSGENKLPLEVTFAADHAQQAATNIQNAIDKKKN